MNLLLLLCAFVTLFCKHTNALPNGAPIGTCISMRPSAGKHGAEARTTDPPYVIEVDKSYYGENSTVKVYIKACGNDTRFRTEVSSLRLGKWTSKYRSGVSPKYHLKRSILIVPQ